MSTVIQIAIAVGDPADGPGVVSLADAGAIAAVAHEVGVTAIRLTDVAGRTLDPTVVGAYLAGIHGGVGYVPEIPTSHHAPYNVARRVLSLDRATGGRVGVALQAGDGDEVSDVSVPDPTATGAARRWTEYAHVLTRLWESFPREALIGDQEAALVVDDALITPIGHEGAFYRVAGPLDGPSSAQGRPVVVADLGVLDAAAVAGSADVVVVDRERATGADAALTDALVRAGRSRRDVALLGRIEVDEHAEATVLRAWADEHRLDGLELAFGGDATAVIAALRTLVPDDAVHRPTRLPTLRSAFGLPGTVAVPA